MKSWVIGLAGTGCAAVVFLAYLSLSQQDEIKKDVSVDKASFDLERAQFDQEFDRKWNDFARTPPSSSVGARHDARVEAAQTELAEARKRRVVATQHSEKDLAELKAAIDAMDKSATPPNSSNSTSTK